MRKLYKREKYVWNILRLPAVENRIDFSSKRLFFMLNIMMQQKANCSGFFTFAYLEGAENNYKYLYK